MLEFAPFHQANGIVEEEQPVETHIIYYKQMNLKNKEDMNLISDEIYRQLVKDLPNASLKQLFSHFDTVQTMLYCRSKYKSTGLFYECTGVVWFSMFVAFKFPLWSI